VSVQSLSRFLLLAMPGTLQISNASLNRPTAGIIVCRIARAIDLLCQC
jgi:hypothetical protein